MTNLDCMVTNCIHNQDKCCCKEEIVVEGNGAKNAGDTCCGSFAERKSNSTRNAVEQPKRETNVECKACDCVHNEDCSCHADHIGVAGSNACTCKETECMTFCCR